MRPADRAWITLAAAVTAWDLSCPRGETLSEGCARYCAAHPVTARVAVVYVAGHLLHAWPPTLDLFTQLTRLAHRT